MVMLQCSPDTAPPPLIPLGTTANPDDVNGRTSVNGQIKDDVRGERS